jgi:environmental stress-induced protein Ves
MRMRKLDARTYATMPWKNGGGTTTEIARDGGGTAAASLDDLDWRVSMATVASAGPFSRFDGLDRSIAILSGEGLTLAIEGGGARGPVTLDRRSPPFTFPADVAVSAALVGGPVEDFNVMTRRGRFRHLLSRARVEAIVSLRPVGHVTLLVVAEGALVAVQGTATEQLAARDGLLLEGSAPVAITPSPSAEVLVVDLWGPGS